MVERSLIFNNPGVIPFAIGLAVVLSALIVYLYAIERKMVPRRLGLVLTGLRAALAVVVLLMLTEPIVSMKTTEPRRGTVIVMVDNSRSMQIADRERPAWEKLRIAGALGLLPEGIHRSHLSACYDATAALLAASDAAIRRWADFAEVMSVGTLDDAERNRRLDESQAGAQNLRKGFEALAVQLQSASRAPYVLPADVADEVEKARHEVIDVGSTVLDEVLRELGSAEFRARLTISRVRRVSELLDRTKARLAELTDRMKQLAIRHDTTLAAAAFQAAPGLAESIDKMTRLDLAARAMTDRHVAFLSKLREKYNVRAYLFAKNTSELPIRDEGGDAKAAVAAPTTAVESLYTNLTDALQNVVNKAGDDEIAGIVVLSDGRVNYGEDPLKLARQYGSQDKPLFPVVVGSTVQPKDLAIVRVDAAEVVYEKDPADARVVVKAAGFRGQEFTLSVHEKGKFIAEKKFTAPADSDRVVVGVSFVPEAKGRHQYTFSVPVQPQETFTNNNEASFSITVIDKKTKVLLVDGNPRWEYRYLKTTLERDSRLELKYLLLNPLSASKEEMTRAIEAFPHKRPDMFAYDTIIFGDVDPAALSPADLANLEAFVADRGGTLIVFAGRYFMPAAYARTPLGRALPVIPAEEAAKPKSTVTAKGFMLNLTDEGRESTIFRLSPDDEENLKTWAGLPKLLWYAPVKEAKPGATVWAYAASEGQDEKVATVASIRGDRAVVASHGYGLGRVFYVGTDETWRWRYKVADKYFHRFWGQVIQWATSAKLPVGTDRVKLGTDRYEYLDGEDIVVRARVLTPQMTPMPDAMVSATLVKKGDGTVVQKAVLEYLATAGGHYEGKFLTVPTGSYVVKLSIPGMEKELETLESEVDVKDAPTRELVELAADALFCQDLAERSGGRAFTVDELGRVQESLRPLKWTRSFTGEIPLWDHWLLLVAFCAIITVEWVLRKRAGLM